MIKSAALRGVLLGAGLLLASALSMASMVELDDEARRQMAFRAPVLEFSPGPVQVAIKSGLCLDCGDYWHANDIAAKYSGIYQMDFRAQLKQAVLESGVLRGTGPRLRWRATLEKFAPSSTVSAYEERQHPLTAGAVLTIRTAVRYELLEGDKVLAGWLIESHGSSGTLQKWDEACGRALARNLRKFFASLKQDLVPDLTAAEISQIALIDGERDGRRSLVGNVMLGLSRAGRTAGDVAWGTMEVLAAAAPAVEQVSQDYSQTHGRNMAAIQAMGEENRRLDAEHAARLKDVDRQRAEQQAELVRERNAAAAVRQTRAQEAATAAVAKAEQDRQQARAQARQQAQREAEVQKRQDEENRRQAEVVRQQAIVQKKAERDAAAAAEKQARKDYLAALADGAVLRARTCPDGEGKYYIVGLLPKIKPRLVDCVNVHYRVSCEGSSAEQEGVGRNFVGVATDCFMGDAVTIEPKPACPVAQVRVRVSEIRGCRE